MPALFVKDVEVRHEGSEVISYLDFLDGSFDIPVFIQKVGENNVAGGEQVVQELPEVLKQTFKNIDGLGGVNAFKPVMQRTKLNTNKLVVRAQHSMDDVLTIRIYVPYSDQYGRERKVPADFKIVHLENFTQTAETHGHNTDPQSLINLMLFLSLKLLFSAGFKVTGASDSANEVSISR